MRKLVGLFAAAVVLVAANPASAATIMFNTGGSGGTSGRTFADGSVNVYVTGWSLYNGVASAASLYQWEYGLGVSNGRNDEHTIDNNGSKIDFVVLSFSQAVTLKTATFTTGWWNMYDTDATISYANVNYAAAGITFNSTGSAFWSAAGAQLTANKYSSASVGKSYNSTRDINPTLVTSNVWLISAKIGDVDTYKDSFKLKGITYDLPPVPPPGGGGAIPEPSTWALLILGMGVIGGAMRRRNRARIAFA